MHFFNPVPLMRLVEIIPGLKTAPWVTEAMTAIGRRMTREPVLCTDSPAFLVNHVGRAFVPESQRILSEGIAAATEIDRILTGAPGFKMGPFALVGPGRHRRAARRHGVGLRALLRRAGVCALPALGAARRRRPATARRPAPAGTPTRTARRSSRRWRRPRRPGPTSVWVRPSEHHADLQAPLIDLFKQAGANVETGDKPSAEALIVVTPIGWDLTTAVVDLKLDAKRAVAVDVLFGMKGPRTLMVTPATDPAIPRCRPRPARGGRPAGGRHQRQPRLRGAARGGPDRQHRLRRGPARHRHPRRHRQGHQARPRLPVRAAGMGRSPRRRPRPASSWSACTPSTASRATGRALGSSAASPSACRCPPPRDASFKARFEFGDCCGFRLRAWPKPPHMPPRRRRPRPCCRP